MGKDSGEPATSSGMPSLARAREGWVARGDGFSQEEIDVILQRAVPILVEVSFVVASARPANGGE